MLLTFAGLDPLLGVRLYYEHKFYQRLADVLKEDLCILIDSKNL